MEDYLPTLSACRLFAGIGADEIHAMLACLSARQRDYLRGEFILHEGEDINAIGLLLSGSALTVQQDAWGNRNIVARTQPGQTFAVAFACADGVTLNISVEAEEACTVLFMDVRRVLTTCSSACEHHAKIIRNLLGELAEKNLMLNEKLTHMGQRTTRGKLMSYFSAEVQKRHSCEFDIPFSRQQLADYLAVERSGLSLELGKMRNEGLIDFQKKHFVIIKEG